MTDNKFYEMFIKAVREQIKDAEDELYNENRDKYVLDEDENDGGVYLDESKLYSDAVQRVSWRFLDNLQDCGRDTASADFVHLIEQEISDVESETLKKY